MSRYLSSAAVVIGSLRAKTIYTNQNDEKFELRLIPNR